MHSQLPVGLQPQPEWNDNQHSVSSLQQNALDPPVLQDAPFGHQHGLPSYGQAAYEPASYSEAAPEPAFDEPQPPGVLQAPAWPGGEVSPLVPCALTEAACQLCTVAMIRPLTAQFVLPCPWSSHRIQEKIVILNLVQAMERAPSGSDPYAAGGQNYYGAGWQAAPAAGNPEKPAPPKVSGPGWGKLGFWGAGQPVKEPEQPAQDQGVLYYGAPEVWASRMLYPLTPFGESAGYFLLGHWE